MGLIGSMPGSDWGTDIVMTAVETTENHVWYTTYTFAADSVCKFRANGSWDDNWGIAQFPWGIATPGGANLPAKAGKYVVIFNDITSSFCFIKL